MYFLKMKNLIVSICLLWLASFTISSCNLLDDGIAEPYFTPDYILPLAHAPHYKHLQKVRPGITSWGQVKYGYAENVEQMLARLKYDIIYIENMSIAVDFKILFFTIATVLQGRGK